MPLFRYAVISLYRYFVMPIVMSPFLNNSDNVINALASVFVKPFVNAVAHLYCRGRVEEVCRTNLYC